MAADIDAVLSRLRERPECRDAVEVIERLTAERDRLREAANTLAAVRADAMWMARLARSSSWPGEMAHRVEVAAERVLSLLGESPVPDEPTQTCCEWLPGTIGAETHCAHWHAADDPEFAGDRASAACCWCGDHEDGSGSCPGPSHPTGEERTDG